MLGVEENFVESGREKWPGKQNFCRENFVKKTLSRFVESLSRVCRGLSRFVEVYRECTVTGLSRIVEHRESPPRHTSTSVSISRGLGWSVSVRPSALHAPSSLFTCSPCNGNKRDSLGPLPLTTS
ncbi:unnamed protein product [Cochlearia groenlandica]